MVFYTIYLKFYFNTKNVLKVIMFKKFEKLNKNINNNERNTKITYLLVNIITNIYKRIIWEVDGRVPLALVQTWSPGRHQKGNKT